MRGEDGKALPLAAYNPRADEDRYQMNRGPSVIMKKASKETALKAKLAVAEKVAAKAARDVEKATKIWQKAQDKVQALQAKIGPQPAPAVLPGGAGDPA